MFRMVKRGAWACASSASRKVVKKCLAPECTALCWWPSTESADGAWRRNALNLTVLCQKRPASRVEPWVLWDDDFDSSLFLGGRSSCRVYGDGIRAQFGALIWTDFIRKSSQKRVVDCCRLWVLPDICGGFSSSINLETLLATIKRSKPWWMMTMIMNYSERLWLWSFFFNYGAVVIVLSYLSIISSWFVSVNSEYLKQTLLAAMNYYCYSNAKPL